MASVRSEDQNCTDVDTLMKEYYLPVAYSIIFIVGLLGNVTAIFVYLTKLRPWKSSSIIMVNLALTDLSYVLSLPFLVYYYSNGDSWRLGDFMCRFVRFSFHFNLYGSILFLTCLAIFRYIVVMKPLRTAQVQQKRWGIVACSAVWIIAAAEITPMLTIITMEKQNNKTYCLDFASTPQVDDIFWYNWLLTVLGFIVPLLVVFMCYIGTTSLCRMRARRMTVIILVVFVVCYLPFHIMRLLRIQTRKMQELSCMMDHVVNAVYIISRPLAGFNTFFNLALYTLSGDMFREAFLSIFYWKCGLTKARSRLQLAVISNTGSDTPTV
ncbi:hypothetical protein Q5P01_005500 [Channa striata]|uniref:G-protein coupled receptors family 1 profile domain-containing protein n=1 Tax=Channa striata TaxID=64152 RepID=A0AA88T1C9_CHASR|nr:hypothetical protein Q5P01_005500 [Channa striata]